MGPDPKVKALSLTGHSEAVCPGPRFPREFTEEC